MHGKDSFSAGSPRFNSESKYLSHDSGSEWIPESGELLNQKNKSPVSSRKEWGGAAQENRQASLPHSEEENVLDEEKGIKVPETCDKDIC